MEHTLYLNNTYTAAHLQMYGIYVIIAISRIFAINLFTPQYSHTRTPETIRIYLCTHTNVIECLILGSHGLLIKVYTYNGGVGGGETLGLTGLRTAAVPAATNDHLLFGATAAVGVC